MINTENLHKLSTKEDSTFIHKYLGGVCLLNYAYRYTHYIIYNSMNLYNNISLYLLLTHGVLSISSLIFHLPSIRNPLKPMIYPEFRLHSIIFGMRSVIISILYFYKLNYIYILGVCYLTFIFADLVTWIYDEKNGKTMRNMPFDPLMLKFEQNKITFMHSCMQIGATIYMLGNIETAFSPLFAIQLAALLMTLVRKNIISAKMWHSVYSLSLWINLMLFLTLPLGFIILYQIMYNNFRYIFFPRKINKYIAWSINFSIYIFYKEYYIEELISFFLDKYLDYIYWIKYFCILFFYYKFFVNYKVLFHN